MFIQKLVEISFSFALFINALLFIPQSIRLWKTKKIEGLSLLTFSGFNLIQMLAMLHGYFKHDYVLLIGFGFSLITCGSVTALLIFYKHKNSRYYNAYKGPL